ncbi:hypothetical protein Tco_1166719, partial [Tanacetum coccineum]
SDTVVLRYHAFQNRSFSIGEDSKIKKEVMKRSGFDLQQESLKQVKEEIVQQDDIVSEQLVGNLIANKILFNEKYASTRPGFDDLILWGDMKIMFQPDDDDAVWKNHHSQELIEWKLYDSCGVYSLMLGEVSIHMLVEKKYPLLQDTLTRMLQWKLHVNYDVTKMAYELLRFIWSQLNQ